MSRTSSLLRLHLSRRPPSFPPPTIPALVRSFLSHTPAALTHLHKSIFKTEISRALMHRHVHYILNSKRQGTHASKTRGQVNGSTRKKRPQKGLGRARIGDGKAGHFRGGGATHGPVSRSHATKLPQKIRQAATRSALAAKFHQDELMIVDTVVLDSHRTADFVKMKESEWRWKDSVLIIGDELELTKLKLATGNIQEGGRVTVLNSVQTNTYDLLKHKHVIISVKALAYIHAYLAKQ